MPPPQPPPADPQHPPRVSQPPLATLPQGQTQSTPVRVSPALVHGAQLFTAIFEHRTKELRAHYDEQIRALTQERDALAAKAKESAHTELAQEVISLRAERGQWLVERSHWEAERASWREQVMKWAEERNEMAKSREEQLRRQSELAQEVQRLRDELLRAGNAQTQEAASSSLLSTMQATEMKSEPGQPETTVEVRSHVRAFQSPR